MFVFQSLFFTKSIILLDEIFLKNEQNIYGLLLQKIVNGPISTLAESFSKAKNIYITIYQNWNSKTWHDVGLNWSIPITAPSNSKTDHHNLQMVSISTMGYYTELVYFMMLTEVLSISEKITIEPWSNTIATI